MMFVKLFCLTVIACAVRADETPTSPVPTPASVSGETSAPTVAESSTADSTTENSGSTTDGGTLELNGTETQPSESPTSIVVNITESTTVVSVTEQQSTQATSPTTSGCIDAKKDLVDRISTQVIRILKHFQNPEPVGFPGQTVLEDPLNVPNTTTGLGSFLTGHFHDVSVHGLSNFTVEAMNTDVDEMEIYMMIKMKKILIIGKSEIDTILGMKTGGPFEIILTNVTAEGTVFLEVEHDGRLVANRSMSYMTYEELTVSTNSSGILQTTLSAAGMAVFTALKPYILKQIDERLNAEANTLLKDVPKIPHITELSPVDWAVVEGRKFMKRFYEPLEIQKIFDYDSEFLAASLGPVRIRGLSNFARVGAIDVKMVNSTLQIGLRMITGRVFGLCHFSYDFGKVQNARNGTADFMIGHLQFQAKINQSIDLRRKPILDDLQVETGKIRIRLDGSGKLDYFAELGMQFLPRMLRYVITDALEEPIKRILQEKVFDKLDLDQIVQDNLPLLKSLWMNSL